MFIAWRWHSARAMDETINESTADSAKQRRGVAVFEHKAAGNAISEVLKRTIRNGVSQAAAVRRTSGSVPYFKP
ncbi:hypothetical protein ACNKHQ_19915 [Shigella flexneri]